MRWVQMLDLTDKDFKAAFTHWSKDVKNNRLFTNVQIVNINRKIKTIQKGTSRNSRTKRITN